QGKPEPMQHEPCGLLANPHVLADLVGTDAILAIDQHPQSCKPLVQTERPILKDRAKLHGELLVALFALPPLLSFQVVVLFVAASRTFGAFWPAHLRHGVNTELLIREVPHGLLKCLWLFHGSKVAE